MAQLYKCGEWETPTGEWHVNCINDLSGISGLWWVPCRILNITPTDFILLLKNEFNVSNISYSKDKDVLLYSWKNYSDAHRWLLYINKIARQKQIML